MMKYKFLWLGLFTLVISILQAQVPLLEDREQVEISDWTFKKGVIYNAQAVAFDNSDWETVTVPHTYSMDAIEEVGYYRGNAWYRAQFNYGKAPGQRTYIRFEGVGQEAKVYVNGQFVGSHIGGYSAFCFEITDALAEDGNNILAVEVNNTPSYKRIPVNDVLFNHYGGIYRNVSIFNTPSVNIDPTYHATSGVFVKLDSLGKTAKIDVNTHFSSTVKALEADVVYTLKDQKGKVILTQNSEVTFQDEKQTVQEQLEILKPILWNGKKNPYLYTLEVKVKSGRTTDVVNQEFGLRTYEVDAERGFVLNGKSYRSYGVAMHQEWEQTGPVLTKEQHEQDIAMIEELGATALRLSHYQHSDYTYELADKNGLLVWAEIPFVHDYSGREQENAKQQLTELILQNYNHPSIVFWGLWNEVRAYDSPEESCVALTKDLNELAHQLDPDRVTVSASDRGDESNMGNLSDLQAWNKYYGWYYGEYEDMGTWLDQYHQKYPNRPVGISEYGVGGNINQHDVSKLEKPVGNYFPEQEQNTYHEISWKIIQDRLFVFSSYIWNMFDFSVAGWNRGGIKNLNHKGLVTFDRQTKKDAFYFYKANWNKYEATLYIVERRFKERTEKTTPVKIYTNQKRVTLYVNGKKIGVYKNQSDINIITVDNIKLQQGENTIKVVSGKLVDEVKWSLK